MKFYRLISYEGEPEALRIILDKVSVNEVGIVAHSRCGNVIIRQEKAFIGIEEQEKTT